MSEGFGMGKTAFVFAVIFGCFAVLYPKIFHPMLKSVLGIYTKPTHRVEELRPKHPKNVPEPRKHSDPYKESIERTVQSLKAGPHPGMRADVNKHGEGIGKGGMAMSVLPIYTVGLVIFLVYTLTKILFKKPSTSEVAREQLKNIHYSSSGKKFIFGDDFEGDDDFREYLRKKEQNPLKGDPRKITEYELNQLQQRLQETEQAMERIVSQMSNVNQKLSTTFLNDSPKINLSEITQVNQEELDPDKDILTVEVEENQEETILSTTEENSETECEIIGITTQLDAEKEKLCSEDFDSPRDEIRKRVSRDIQ